LEENSGSGSRLVDGERLSFGFGIISVGKMQKKKGLASAEAAPSQTPSTSRLTLEFSSVSGRQLSRACQIIVTILKG
jgi:hypothetical protein